MNNRVLEKIKKCLRLATSDNPAEAAAGLRQAQKLMAMHGLTQSDLELSEVSSHRVKSVACRDIVFHVVGHGLSLIFTEAPAREAVRRELVVMGWR